MSLDDLARSLPARVLVGLLAGVAIATVDNTASGGEVSPIVIVAMLLAASGIAGTFWGRRAWAAAFFTWACVPSAHLAKHVLGLPDTLHPNTYASILKLAAFSLALATVGTACGILLRTLIATAESGSPGRV
ncbi:MAG: hypothetical protein WCC53_05885 [Thermoanaerobaculia bacterium]